jgi:antitoxin HigA-1
VHASKFRLILSSLEQAGLLADMDLPGLRLHELKSGRKGSGQLRGLSLMNLYNPAHPGEVLKELIVDSLGLSITEVSEYLNVSRKTLSKVLNGRGAITPEMALRLELVFRKPSADHWLKLQNSYDLWQTRLNTSALNVMPYKESA